MVSTAVSVISLKTKFEWGDIDRRLNQWWSDLRFA